MRAEPRLEGCRSASGRARPEERAVEIDVELDGREPVRRGIHRVAVGREPMARPAGLPRAAHEPVLAVLGLPHPLALRGEGVVAAGMRTAKAGTREPELPA